MDFCTKLSIQLLLIWPEWRCRYNSQKSYINTSRRTQNTDDTALAPQNFRIITLIYKFVFDLVWWFVQHKVCCIGNLVQGTTTCFFSASLFCCFAWMSFAAQWRMFWGSWDFRANCWISEKWRINGLVYYIISLLMHYDEWQQSFVENLVWVKNG